MRYTDEEKSAMIQHLKREVDTQTKTLKEMKHTLTVLSIVGGSDEEWDALHEYLEYCAQEDERTANSIKDHH